MDQMIQDGRIPKITAMVCFEHTFQGMGSEGPQGDSKKTRRTGRDQCGATVHESFVRLLRRDLELLRELLEEALNGPGGRLAEGTDRATSDVVGDVL